MGKQNIKNGQVFALFIEMRFKIFICCLLSLGNSLLSQHRNFQDQAWDFGDVNFWNNDTAWFTVTNATDKKLVFLPTYNSENVQLIFSGKFAESGESVKIGMVYYSEKLGKFNMVVPIYINLRGEPIRFTLRGNIKSFNPLAQMRCPVVNGNASENKPEKVVAIEVRDLKTEELLVPDALSVKNRHNQIINLSRKDMEYQMAVPSGAYKVTAAKNGYNDYLALINLEPYQLRFVVYLEKLDLPPVAEETEDDFSEEDAIPEPVIEVTAEVHEHQKDTSVAEITISEGLNENYKLNNVIMIVDVSSSMNRGGKLDALKSSFNTLIDALRPSDLVSIISMNSNAELIQEPVGVSKKDSLKSKIETMKALGGTNGGAALQLAYNLAKKNFIPDGNNQIIIATDGIFYGGTLTRRQIEALIAQGSSDGIHLSAVAFGSDPKAILFLSNLTEKGSGTFVQVSESAPNENALLDMIKNQSRR